MAKTNLKPGMLRSLLTTQVQDKIMTHNLMMINRPHWEALNIIVGNKKIKSTELHTDDIINMTDEELIVALEAIAFRMGQISQN